jgi:hypothetical protein
MTTARKYRGKPAKFPREVKFLGIARGFRGNGNLNPAFCKSGNFAHYWPFRIVDAIYLSLNAQISRIWYNR